MSITLSKLGKPSLLPAGEQVLFVQRRFRLVSSRTAPSYRVGFNLPPFWRMSIVVTNRRCLVYTNLFLCMTQEIGMWYPGQNPEGDPETITAVRLDSGILGPCLEIRSNNPNRKCRWIWSPDLTLRFYFKKASEAEAVIQRAMQGQIT